MKTFGVPRPTDPELRRQWDEAKQAILDRDCCVGDRSQCRCAPERGGWSDEDVEREKWLQVWAGDEP